MSQLAHLGALVVRKISCRVQDILPYKEQSLAGWPSSVLEFRTPRVSKMTPEEQEQLNALCQRVTEEKNPEKFDEAVRQLNDLLDKKVGRIREMWKADPFVTKPSEIRHKNDAANH